MVAKPISTLVVSAALAWMDTRFLLGGVVILIVATQLGMYWAIRLYVDQRIRDRQRSSKEPSARQRWRQRSTR